MNDQATPPTNPTETLFGGRELPVKLEDGRDATVTVRQLRLRDYPGAFALLDQEFKFVALACDTKPALIEALHPESYERVFAAVKEINKEGFFVYAARQAERAQENLRNLPPALVERLISSRLSPTSPPVRG